ncbi:MAG: hypothetical protein ABI649_06260 [Gaiellaceae bacterium]
MLPVVLALAGCGGGDEPPRNDIRTMREILQSSALVQRAVAPLYQCAPDDADCYRAAGPGIVEAVASERASLGDVLQETESECLAEVARRFDDSLAAYAAAGRAAVQGDVAAADQAISRSSQVEISYLRRLDECGFSEGKVAEIGSEMRRINIEVIQLTEELVSCKTQDCVAEVSRELEVAAHQGSGAIESLLAEIPSETPGCLADGLRLMARSFRSLELAATAIGEEDFETAEREGVQSDEMRSQAQERLAACLTTALSVG